MISAKLIASLLTAIAGYTGYAIPVVAPEIIAIPQSELAEQVCSRPCGVLAFTTPEGRILVDDSLHIGTDPVATSILVHELTHFMQLHAHAKHDPHTASRGATLHLPLDCQDWGARESEAYYVQLQWLRDTAPTIREFSLELSRLGARPVFKAC